MNRVNEKISRSGKSQGEISQALVMINLRLCAFQLRKTSYRPSAKSGGQMDGQADGRTRLVTTTGIRQNFGEA